jgi:glycosyltransferase involved in cell wall biosynthesis
MPAVPEISALVTCYFEEKSIDEFYGKLSQALEASGRTYEIVFVNDGSTDETLAKLISIFENDPRVAAVVDFFANAGQAAAVTAAMCEARGRILLSIDSDLQLDPAELPILLAEYDRGNDVVSGYRKERHDSLFRILPSRIANMIMRRASKSEFTDFGCTFKLYNADLIRAFNLGPLNIFNPVNVIAKVNRRTEVPVSHFARRYGKSGWTFAKLWKYQMEHVLKLSERPFQYMGIAAAVLGFLFFIRVALAWITPVRVLREVTPGLLLNFVVIQFLVLFALLCLVGEFSIRVFSATLSEPKYIVRSRLRR